MYSISIHPPIIAMLVLIFLMLLDVLVGIYLWDTVTLLRRGVGIKDVLTYIVKLLLYVIMVLIYVNLK